MSTAFNIAVIGFGRMGRIYANTVLTEVDEARLLAVVDPVVDPEKELGKGVVPHVYDDAASALALRDLDGVIIASPTSTHRDLVEQAAEAGTAIFCEKPLTLTRSNTEEALAAVEEAGVPLQVGFMRRFNEAYRDVYRHIQAGRIGRPLTFRSVGRDLRCPDPAFADPAHSGGLILDVGIHDFDLARWLMDAEVERVTAEGQLLVCDDLQAVNDIDNAVITLTFEGGGLGTVEVSRNATYGYDVRTEVMGTEGVARVNGSHKTGPEGTATLTPADGGQDEENYLTARFGEAYRAQIHHFVECVRTDQDPAVGGADAQAALDVALAATVSAQTDESVAIEDLRANESPDRAIL